MNHPAAPPSAAASAADWTAANQDVLRLGFEWLMGGEGAGKDAASAIDARREAFQSARARMELEGRPCALDAVARTFNLAPFDCDLLLLALGAAEHAPLADRLGERRGRGGQVRLRLDDVHRLLAPDTAMQNLARDRLLPTQPLRRFCLIELDGHGLDSTIGLDERMAGLINGYDFVDRRLADVFDPVPAMPVAPRHQASARRITGKLAEADRPVVQLVGPRRSGRRAVAQQLAADFGLVLVRLEAHALPATAEQWHPLIPLIAREAALLRLALLVEAVPEAHGPEGAEAPAARLAEDLGRLFDGLLLIVAEEPLNRLRDVLVEAVEPLAAPERLALWQQALPQAGEWLGLVADHFHFGPVEIARATRLLDGANIDQPTLWTSCRETAGSRLDGLAQRIEPRRSWDSIVLPEAVMAQLRAVAAQVRHRHTVFSEWGYDALLPHGRGVSVLFAGPSGAGKTMAAEIIACDLALDLYRVDLAGVVSKYIGETEKNLKKIFDSAEESGAVLFIDEADALFGKRSEVKDSHDRYANVEVSYLLQRMESYAGLAILATNLKSHIDFAFMRRLRNVIDIPFPDFEHRLAIWRKSFPQAAPLDEIAFERLASLEIAGGNIIVIATNAAFLAAADDSAIAMRHVIAAASAEFRKLDRTLDPSFGGRK